MAILTVRERMEAYGIFENGAQKIEKEDQSLEDIRKEITDMAIAGESGAYELYNRIVRKEDDGRKMQAKSEMEVILKEFNKILAKDIRKSNESFEDEKCRVLIEN